MKPHRLHRLIERLEQQKSELVSRIEAWPREWLSYKPSPSEWSAVEVLDHLRKTELAVMQSCEQNLKLRTHEVTPSERAKAVALLALMRLPIKLKVPEPVSFVRPDPLTSLEDVLDFPTDAFRGQHFPKECNGNVANYHGGKRF